MLRKTLNRLKLRRSIWQCCDENKLQKRGKTKKGIVHVAYNTENNNVELRIVVFIEQLY